MITASVTRFKQFGAFAVLVGTAVIYYQHHRAQVFPRNVDIQTIQRSKYILNGKDVEPLDLGSYFAVPKKTLNTEQSTENLQVQLQSEASIVSPKTPPKLPPPPTSQPTSTPRKKLQAAIDEEARGKVHLRDSTGKIRRTHYLFSTSCTQYQQWQSEVLFWSHKHNVADLEKGSTITRLVSGCGAAPLTSDELKFAVPGDADVVRSMTLLNSSSNPVAIVRHTPELPESRVIVFSNKPYGVLDWVQHADVDDDDIVVILDPDFIMLKPVPWIFQHRERGSYPSISVSDGNPISQHYEIGAAWVNELGRRYLNGSSFPERVCGKGSYCTEVSERYAEEHLQGGPPMMITGGDLLPVANDWHKFTSTFNNVTNRGEMIAEMWTYSMALAHNRLDQNLTNSLMVSATQLDEGEAWHRMEGTGSNEEKGSLANFSCHNPFETIHADKLPPYLHFCQFYRAWDANGRMWAFHKGHVPTYILDCDIPLIKLPPDDLYNVQTTSQGRRNAFIICTIYASINHAVLDYTKKFCPHSALGKKKKTVRIMDSFINTGPTRCTNKDRRLCFDFALIEPEDPFIGDGNMSTKAWRDLHITEQEQEERERT